MNRMIRTRRSIVFAVIALASTLSLVGYSRLESPEAHAQNDARDRFYVAERLFGFVAGQRARFCTGSPREPGSVIYFTIHISNDQGALLLQVPETQSPAGQWRCVDVHRSSIPVAGEPTSGRVQVAARQIVRAPAGTQASDIVGSFELINADGTTQGAVAGVLYAAFHNND